MALERVEIQYQGAALSFYPDHTQKVVDARRKFKDIQALLKNKGFRFVMLYPAKLKVDWQGKPFFFTTPKDAITFCKRHYGSRGGG